MYRLESASRRRARAGRDEPEERNQVPRSPDAMCSAPLGSGGSVWCR